MVLARAGSDAASQCGAVSQQAFFSGVILSYGHFAA